MAERPTIVITGFRTTYERSFDEAGKPTGRKDRAVDWVQYSPAHMAMFQSAWERVEWMRPENIRNKSDDENGSKKEDFFRYRWAQIEPAYSAWKKGHEIPIDGTPLSNWPGLNAAQAEVFRKLAIQSVEQVATLPESVMSKVQLPGIREIKAQAQAFLDAQGDAQIATRLADVEAENASLREQFEAAMALLKEQAETAHAKPKKVKEAA